jgi:hypothetical protein
MPRVVFKTPGKMNLLGYILRTLVERNLETPKGARAFSKMKGTVVVGASRMLVTLDVSLGKGMIWPVVTRRLKVAGKVWRLLRMLPLLKAEGA